MTAGGLLSAPPVTAAPAATDLGSPDEVRRGEYEDRQAPAVEGAPLPAPAGQPRVDALPAGTELVGLREERVKVYATGEPGRHRAEVFAGRVHFRDAAGKWQPIDSRLISRGPDAVGNAANDVRVDFALPATAATLGELRLAVGCVKDPGQVLGLIRLRRLPRRGSR